MTFDAKFLRSVKFNYTVDKTHLRTLSRI